jgi:hypothetical protein
VSRLNERDELSQITASAARWIRRRDEDDE